MTSSPSPTPASEATAALIARRAAALAPSYELFYDDPVELVRGDGVMLPAKEKRP